MAIEDGYDALEAKESLLARFSEIARAIAGHAPGSCPEGYAAIEIILHPERLAANFPHPYLRYLGLTFLGSRRLKICPRRLFAALAEKASQSPEAGTVSLWVAAAGGKVQGNPPGLTCRPTDGLPGDGQPHPAPGSPEDGRPDRAGLLRGRPAPHAR
jgi:hypothetical protein